MTGLLWKIQNWTPRWGVYHNQPTALTPLRGGPLEDTEEKWFLEEEEKSGSAVAELAPGSQFH